MSGRALDAQDAVTNETDLVPPPSLSPGGHRASWEDPETSKQGNKLQIVIQSEERINMAW